MSNLGAGALFMAGTLEVKGDFTSGASYGLAHRVLLSGTERQTVTAGTFFDSYTMGILELDNPSGVAFVSAMVGGTLRATPTTPIYNGQNLRVQGAVLDFDRWNGDLTIGRGYVNVGRAVQINGNVGLHGWSGNELTLNGDMQINGHVVHAGGSLIINAARLTINGNYTSGGPAGDGAIYLPNTQILMTDVLSYLYVGGNFIFSSGQQPNALQLGTIEVKGDYYIYSAAFRPGRVVFSGAAQQTVTLGAPLMPGVWLFVSPFEALELANTSPAGVTIASRLVVNAAFNHNGNYTLLYTASFPITGVAVVPNNATMLRGTSRQLYATVQGRYALPQDVWWGLGGFQSGGTFIDEDGVLHVAPDEMAETLFITVTARHTSTIPGAERVANITVAVTNTATLVTGVAITGGAAPPLAIDETRTLSAAITPAAATNHMVTWASSAPAVATVSARGQVTAISAGTAVITVRTACGNHTATVTVTVAEPAPPPTIADAVILALKAPAADVLAVLKILTGQ